MRFTLINRERAGVVVITHSEEFEFKALGLASHKCLKRAASQDGYFGKVASGLSGEGFLSDLPWLIGLCSTYRQERKAEANESRDERRDERAS